MRRRKDRTCVGNAEATESTLFSSPLVFLLLTNQVKHGLRALVSNISTFAHLSLLHAVVQPLELVNFSRDRFHPLSLDVVLSHLLLYESLLCLLCLAASCRSLKVP